MRLFVVDPFGEAHTGEWEEMPKFIVKAGDCKHGLAQDGDFYFLKGGRPHGVSSAHSLCCGLYGEGVYPDAHDWLFNDPRVKFGVFLTDDAEWRAVEKLAYETFRSMQGCGGCE